MGDAYPPGRDKRAAYHALSMIRPDTCRPLLLTNRIRDGGSHQSVHCSGRPSVQSDRSGRPLVTAIRIPKVPCHVRGLGGSLHCGHQRQATPQSQEAGTAAGEREAPHT